MGASYDQTFGFSWSPASQLLTRTASNAAYKWATPTPGTTANAYDGLNRDAGLVTAGGYDARGNLTADGSRTFTYDVENRMLTAVSGATTVTFAYDPIGRLSTTAVPTATTFLYDSDRLSAEYSATGTLLRRYVHGPGVDEPLVWYEGATTSYPQFLHQDRQGSVIAWSSVNGYVDTPRVYKYGPWGEPGDNWASGASRFRYTGQIAIPEARLYHYKARMYDPATGRFMQTDPIGYQDDLDLYAYVGGDPVNKTDPDGKCRNRDGGGECVVTNTAGTAGEAAAASLQQQVRNVDRAIRGLDAKAKVKVAVGGGKTREMTGAQLQKAWARTTWTIVPESTRIANGYGAQMTSTGSFTGKPSYLESFRTSATLGGRDADEATRSVVLHDFGHSTKAGADIERNYRGNFNERERATSRLGRDIGNAAGVTFECGTFDLGC